MKCRNVSSIGNIRVKKLSPRNEYLEQINKERCQNYKKLITLYIAFWYIYFTIKVSFKITLKSKKKLHKYRTKSSWR